MPADPPSGTYPIEVTHAAELERLRRQNDAWDRDTQALLDAIGVRKGWTCLDLGCGPEGLTHTLASRVGTAGKVTGLEYNPDFADIASRHAPHNVEIIQGDAYATGLPDCAFDLVHMRFLASTSGEPERLIAEAARVTKPGGWIAMQEADGRTMQVYPPIPASTRLTDAIRAVFADANSEHPHAHQHYRMLLDAGLQEVGYRPCVVGQRAGDLWQDYIPATAEALRSALVSSGYTAEALRTDVQTLRDHLSLPGTVFIGPMLVQVWGRKREA